ncbi:hypothetical protein [Clostridium thailandense]|uniref:hypothetical protein n=1 Tax=Clostridium thailandense TaxID=2794346 RepID=UPI003989E25D
MKIAADTKADEGIVISQAASISFPISNLHVTERFTALKFRSALCKSVLSLLYCFTY